MSLYAQHGLSGCHGSCREAVRRPLLSAGRGLHTTGGEAAALVTPRYGRSWRLTTCVRLQAQQQNLAHMDEEEDDEGMQASKSSEHSELSLPDQYHQQKLSMKDIKALRTASNTLAQEGNIQRIICGQKGITQSFLNACADALAKHQFLRVKLGEGAGLERGQAATALEQYLDAVAVHQVGFTITLHRQQGLPRPSNCPEAVRPVVEAPAPDTPSHDEIAASTKPKVPHKRASAKSAERVAVAKAAAKVAAKQRQEGPPEFSLIP